MEGLVEYLARALVDHSDDVSVDSYEEDDGSIVYELSVAEDDVGKVIGRGGRTVSALRCVLRACAAKQGRRLLLDVVD
jgi:predicted RNA-binding protein YlqC (UPF0109 family)